MGIRRAVISDAFLHHMITKGRSIGGDGYGIFCTEGIPLNAQLVGAGVQADGHGGRLLVLEFEHPDWPVLPPGTLTEPIHIVHKKEQLDDEWLKPE